ncbi:hypothetical protein NUW58_g8144 [Xylaria curta]|uniref:Uncharacterized protein n=1 Tax=Xylaria curta TaxID=42375 RepID=A0ACC1NAB5_9PEZI|nr:hypothetical protein NUW58_g8144 [Xylaria curta]
MRSFLRRLHSAQVAALAIMAILLCAWFWPVSDDIYLSRLHRDIKIAESDPNADVYSYLGVSQSATEVEISSAYRNTYRQLVRGSASKAELSLLGAAVRALTTPRLRHKYNRVLKDEELFFDL